MSALTAHGTEEALLCAGPVLAPVRRAHLALFQALEGDGLLCPFYMQDTQAQERGATCSDHTPRNGQSCDLNRPRAKPHCATLHPEQRGKVPKVCPARWE